MRAAALYLLLDSPALVRAVSEFAEGNLAPAQLTDAVSQNWGAVGRKFSVSVEDVCALLQRHAVAAFAKY